MKLRAIVLPLACFEGCCCWVSLEMGSRSQGVSHFFAVCHALCLAHLLRHSGCCKKSGIRPKTPGLLMFSKDSPAPSKKHLSFTGAVLGAMGKGHGSALPYSSPQQSVLLDPGILTPSELLGKPEKGINLTPEFNGTPRE